MVDWSKFKAEVFGSLPVSASAENFLFKHEQIYFTGCSIMFDVGYCQHNLSVLGHSRKL